MINPIEPTGPTTDAMTGIRSLLAAIDENPTLRRAEDVMVPVAWLRALAARVAVQDFALKAPAPEIRAAFARGFRYGCGANVSDEMDLLRKLSDAWKKESAHPPETKGGDTAAREARPGEVDAYFAEEHAKAEAKGREWRIAWVPNQGVMAVEGPMVDRYAEPVTVREILPPESQTAKPAKSQPCEVCRTPSPDSAYGHLCDTHYMEAQK